MNAPVFSLFQQNEQIKMKFNVISHDTHVVTIIIITLYVDLWVKLHLILNVCQFCLDDCTVQCVKNVLFKVAEVKIVYQ